MACSNPIVAIPPRFAHLGDNFNKRYRILGNYRSIRCDFIPTIDKVSGELRDVVYLPCGKCLECRLEYSRKWATRIMLEVETSLSNSCWFLTLTYDDLHLTYKNGYPTLVKKHVQDFVKRLRERMRPLGFDNIRYYCSGEYGEKTFRPHYHICVFNLPLDDLTFYKSNFNADIMYNSALLNDVWSFGHVVVGSLDFSSASYVARYCMKKAQTTEATDFIIEHDLQTEFSVMSRRPAIGTKYFELHPECIDQDMVYLSDGKTSFVPRIFLDHFKDIDPLKYAKIKSKRCRLGEINSDTSLALQNLSKRDFLVNQERKTEKRTKSLVRDL